ncbi:LysR family transcriptional regulator [Desulfitobacterium sp. THU1]|uniref:LysR family transcriptional regulator n=1 Tax=Desulfitobacterium sp. THU1 TaxID=3138072 RepID=UPI00311E0D79
MYIRQLKCFVLAAEYKSFVRAAEKLYITQPAVSHQMNALEEELNIKLFNRSNRKIELTDAGRHFYDYAIKIVDMAEIAIRETTLIDHNSRITLKVKFFATLQEDCAPMLVKEYREKHPQINVILSQISPPLELLSNVIQEKNSLLIIPEDFIIGMNDVDFTFLYKANLCCVLHENHSLASRKIITTRDLYNCNLIFPPEEAAPPYNLELRSFITNIVKDFRLLEVSDPESCIGLINSYMGIAIVPDSSAPKRPGLMSIPFQSDITINFGIAANKDASKVMRDFISMASRIYQS